MTDVIVKVIKIKGNCQMYKEGDSFLIREGYKLDAKKTLCMHSLLSIMPYYVALSKGVNYEDTGLGKESIKVQCLDPNYCADSGTVIFEVRRKNESNRKNKK